MRYSYGGLDFLDGFPVSRVHGFFDIRDRGEMFLGEVFRMVLLDSLDVGGETDFFSYF